MGDTIGCLGPEREAEEVGIGWRADDVDFREHDTWKISIHLLAYATVRNFSIQVDEMQMQEEKYQLWINHWESDEGAEPVISETPKPPIIQKIGSPASRVYDGCERIPPWTIGPDPHKIGTRKDMPLHVYNVAQCVLFQCDHIPYPLLSPTLLLGGDI
ncbi:hypothetical protein HPP92_011021 [Vanilla planifolia]|uniref:Uncharacterized protein n=1 Tax=Vanilla planifolia TaxID=51239 RepID=A0A835QY82_VANPL|nr:hypothetical protein HPP92_011021 [Vanilla planifolia]